MSENDYEAEADLLAFLILQKMKEREHKEHFRQLRKLKTPTDKAVYQFLMFTGPSSYRNIRRALDIGHHGLSDSLKRMKEAGVICQMEDNRYALVEKSKELAELKNILEKLDEEIAESEEIVTAKLSHLDLFGNPQFWKIIQDDFYAFMVGEISGEEYSARLERKAEAFLERRSQKPE